MDMQQDMLSGRYARCLRPEDSLPSPYGGALVQALLRGAEDDALTARLRELPQVPITPADWLDMALIASGAFSPLDGFMTRAAYETVLSRTALPDGRAWGLPLTLAVPSDVAASLRDGNEVALSCGQQPVGVMRIEDVYRWDADRERHALGLVSDDPRTRARRARGASHLLGGPVALLARRDTDADPYGHHTPHELRRHVASRGWARLAVPHLRRTWMRTHEYLLRCALEVCEGLLLHTPVEAVSVPHGVAPDALADASRALVDHYLPAQRVIRNPVPAALLGTTPRAVLNHAILCQNYGVSELIVPESIGGGPLRELLDQARAHGLGTRVLLMPDAFHCEPCGGIASDRSCPHDSGQRVAANEEEVIERVRSGEALSPLVVRPEIARALSRALADQPDAKVERSVRHLHPHASEVTRELRQAVAGHGACALWMTGLSGSGKSTIAHRLERELLLSGHRVFVLDGDTLRHGLNRDLDFSETGRRENLRRAAEVVRIMVEAGMIVIASFISPFRAERQQVRELLGSAFHEVYVHAPIETCEQRDPKGLYKRARAGQIPQFTGISSPYEVPESPDVLLNTSVYSLEQCVERLQDYLAGAASLRPRRSGARPAAASPHGPIKIQ